MNIQVFTYPNWSWSRNSRHRRKAATDEKPKRFHTTVYLDKESYGKVNIALIQEGEDRDFNRLVNDLLKDWLEMDGE